MKTIKFLLILILGIGIGVVSGFSLDRKLVFPAKTIIEYREREECIETQQYIDLQTDYDSCTNVLLSLAEEPKIIEDASDLLAVLPLKDLQTQIGQLEGAYNRLYNECSQTVISNTALMAEIEELKINRDVWKDAWFNK